MMFEPGAAHAFREREQEIVVVVVMSAVKLVGLLNEGFVFLDLIGGGVQEFSPVGDDVEAHRGWAARIKVYLACVTTSDHGRVSQGVKVDRLEMGDAAQI